MPLLMKRKQTWQISSYMKGLRGTCRIKMWAGIVDIEYEMEMKNIAFTSGVTFSQTWIES